MIDSVKDNNIKKEDIQEFEDKDGNVYNKKLYMDLRDQGLI